MSSELPWSPVTGTLEILELGELGDEERRLVEIASHSAQTLLAVIGDVLDFSKIEAGHLDLMPVSTSIGQLVSDLIDQHRLASHGGVELRLGVDDGWPPSTTSTRVACARSWKI